MSGKQSDFDILMEHGIDIRGRTVFLQGDVEKELIHKKIKQIMYLDKTVGGITVILDSEGGDVNLGFSMYDAIQLCRNEVEVKVVGVAMSMGSIILQAGDKRTITKNSRIMIHRGQMCVEGHFTDVQRAVADNAELDSKCVSIFLSKIKEAKTDFKRSQVQRMMDFDYYISAEKALELGLVDEIDGED